MDREQTTIRLPLELKERIAQKAQEMGLSFNALVIKYLLQGLEEDE